MRDRLRGRGGLVGLDVTLRQHHALAVEPAHRGDRVEEFTLVIGVVGRELEERLLLLARDREIVEQVGVELLLDEREQVLVELGGDALAHVGVALFPVFLAELCRIEREHLHSGGVLSSPYWSDGRRVCHTVR